MDIFGQDHRPWEKRSDLQTESFPKSRLRLPYQQEFQENPMPLEGPFQIDLSNTDFNDQEAVKAILQHLSNLVEALYRETLALKAENQMLKDEINRLKGEKGRPDIKPPSPIKKEELNKEPKPEKEWEKQSKLDKIKIDDTKIIRYEGTLPDDAQHKGYRSVVVQDISIKTNNIEFKSRTSQILKCGIN